MKRPVVILILCLLAGTLAWKELRQASEAVAQKATPGADATSAPTAPEPAKPETSGPVSVKNLPMESVSILPAPAPSAVPPVVTPAGPADGVTAGDGRTGPRFKRAYMLSLDKGEVTFLEAQDIEGDFAPPRRKPEEWSGMLRCRLVSATNAILAEELLPAPDHLCAVLDPKSGSDKPVKYTVAGPVVFQVRMPRVKGASRLDIYRIIQPGEQPLEGLLGSIPLPPS